MRDSQRLKIAYGGVTFNEDGFACPDGDMSVCMGMEDNMGAKVNALRHGPKSVMQLPSSEWTVLYVHHIVNGDIVLLRRDWTHGEGQDSVACRTYHYLDVTEGYPQLASAEGLAEGIIPIMNDASYIVNEGEEDEETVPYSTIGLEQIRHVGRTLIARSADGTLHYLLWKDGAYKYLGTKMPELTVRFGLQAIMDRFYGNHEVRQNNVKDGEDTPIDYSEAESLFGNISDDIIGAELGTGKWAIDEDYQANVTETIMAKVKILVAQCHEKGWFCQPFLVRFGLRMYDNTVVMQSAPVLMPVVHPTMGITMPWAVVDTESFNKWHLDYVRAALDMAADEASLNALKEWKDIVTGIEIAVSAPLYTYDPAGKCKHIYGAKDSNDSATQTFFYDMEESLSVKTISSLSENLRLLGTDYCKELDNKWDSKYVFKSAYRAADVDAFKAQRKIVHATTSDTIDGRNVTVYKSLYEESGEEGEIQLLVIDPLTAIGQNKARLAENSLEGNVKPLFIEVIKAAHIADWQFILITPQNAQSRNVDLYETEQGSILVNRSSSSRYFAIAYDSPSGNYHGYYATTRSNSEFGTDRQYFYNGEGNRYGFNFPYSIIHLPEITQKEWEEKVRDCEVFRRFARLDLDEIPTERTIIHPEKNVLAYLSSQPIMEDEYHSHEELKAENIYVYNERVNLCGVHSSLYAGFMPSTLFAWQDEKQENIHNILNPQHFVDFTVRWDLQITYEIEDAEGNRQVVKSAVEEGQGSSSFCQYLYYPRTGVKRIWLLVHGKSQDSVWNKWVYKSIEPKEHLGLNGSIYVGDIGSTVGWWHFSDGWHVIDGDNPVPVESGAPFYYPSKLYTSEAENPWTYKSENINTIGSGKILGMAIAARSISEGTPAGTYPMYCMTDTGVWILQPNGQGGWLSKQAIMSDIVTLPDAILELDNAVVMPTDRGIVLLQGETGEVIIDTSHISAPLTAQDLPGTTELFNHWRDLKGMKSVQDGQTVYDGIFLDVAGYLSSPDLRATYDYRNNRIVFFQPGKAMAVVYDLFAKQICTQPWQVCGAVRSTGDCLVMLKDTHYGEQQGGNVYVDETWHLADLSDMRHKRKDSDTPVALNTPDVGILVTRPIKGTELGMRDVRKQLDTLWHQGRYGKFRLNIVVWGTEDYKNWHIVGQAANASGLYGHHGAHWMAFIVAIIAPSLPLSDHLDSCDLMLYPRLTGKSPAIVGYDDSTQVNT